MTGVRLILKDHQWKQMEPHLPGKRSDPGRTGKDNRLTWGNGSTMFYQGDIGNSPAVFHFGIQGLSLFDVTQLVSKHGQTHIRSPFLTAAPISRFRRARLRRTRPFFLNGSSSHADYRFVRLDPPGMIRPWKITKFGLFLSSGFLHHGTFDDDTGGHIFPQRYQ
jgi:hypothetical protein